MIIGGEVFFFLKSYTYTKKIAKEQKINRAILGMYIIR